MTTLLLLLLLLPLTWAEDAAFAPPPPRIDPRFLAADPSAPPAHLTPTTGRVGPDPVTHPF